MNAWLGKNTPEKATASGAAYFFGRGLGWPGCSLGCMVIVPSIILLWPSRSIMVRPCGLWQVPSGMHSEPSPMVNVTVIGVMTPLFTTSMLPSFIRQ